MQESQTHWFNASSLEAEGDYMLGGLVQDLPDDPLMSFLEIQG